MAEPITVAVRRGGVVESRHRVDAVAVRDGAVVAEAGDGGLVCYLRSSAKPIQALPVVRARPDLDDREIAIACASHRADPRQVGAVRSLLAKAPAQEDELECGPDGDPPERIKHNCSGKHAGFLALCRAQSWDSRGYRLADHPVQRAMLAEVATAADVAESEIPTAVDGCGVITFALPLERMAYVFSRLAELEAGSKVAGAMRANPELIRGPGAPDTVLMESLAGWVAKGGAEGLMCAAGPDGIGVALKIEDGAGRGVGPALAAFLGRLGHPLPQLDEAPLENSRGESVGEIRAD
jgi:L-asparaginase II